MIHKDNAGDEYLNALRDGSFKLGLGIGCPLDQHLRYKKSDFNVIAGHANVGKTIGILYYYVCLAKLHDLKFLIFSSENEIGSLKDDLITLSQSRKVPNMKDYEYMNAKHWVNEHFKFFNADGFFYKNKRLMNFRDILQEVETVKTYYNFDSLVIDPYNSLGRVQEIKGNTHEYDYQVMSELRIWCKREDKSLYLLAHGNTDALRKVFFKGHDFEGFPMPLVSADIEGGGKFVNRCDNFIVLHRMTQHTSEWMKTEWHITKIKNTKTGGKPTFKHNPVIFHAKNNMLTFDVYIRPDIYTDTPSVIKNPLAEINGYKEPKPLDLSKVSNGFELNVNEDDAPF